MVCGATIVAQFDEGERSCGCAFVVLSPEVDTNLNVSHSSISGVEYRRLGSIGLGLVRTWNYWWGQYAMQPGDLGLILKG